MSLAVVTVVAAILVDGCGGGEQQLGSTACPTYWKSQRLE